MDSVFGHERCIPPRLIEGQLEVAFTGQTGFHLPPIAGVGEPSGADLFPSDGGLEQVDV